MYISICSGLEANIGGTVLRCVRCDVDSCVHCPSPCKLSQLGAFQGDGPEWSTLRKFHCSRISGADGGQRV